VVDPLWHVPLVNVWCHTPPWPLLPSRHEEAMMLHSRQAYIRSYVSTSINLLTEHVSVPLSQSNV
jgi:hypothetical protein